MNLTLPLATLLLSLSAAISHAAIIKKVDFEDGRVGSAGAHPQLNTSGNDPEIVTAQSGVSPRAGKYMMRTYLNRQTSATNFRTEVSLSNLDFDKGKEYWLGVSVYLPKDWSMNYGDTWHNQGIVLQFHDYAYKNPDWRSLLPLTVAHTAKGWVVSNNPLPGKEINQIKGSGNLETFSATVPYKLGQWTDFVMNVKFSGAQSANDTNGFIRVWVNGEQVVNYTGQNYYGEQTQGPYFKMGLYSAGWKSQDAWSGPDYRILYHDELRVGDSLSSFAEVSPEPVSTTTVNPPSPPSNIQAN